MATPQAISAWSELDQRLGLQRHLEGILITHHHPDHFGLAQHLAQRFAVPLHMSSGAWSAALASF
ncbi:MAG TPA: MBL fold metallo-hydrolase, partial [Steroidobacteraceae bacterium]